MPVRVPDRVREVWGDELVVELAPWFQEMIGEYAVPRDEYREVLSRLDRLEKDVSLIKEELAGLRTEMGKLRDQLRAEYADGLAQLRAEFADGQAQLRAGFADGQPQVRAEYADGQAQIRAEFRRTWASSDERCRAVSTTCTLGSTRWEPASRAASTK